MPITQSVTTVLTASKFIWSVGTLPCFCNVTSFWARTSRCSSHTTASMYSPSSDDTDTTKAGGSRHGRPSTLIEHFSGRSTSFQGQPHNIKHARTSFTKNLNEQKYASRG